MTMDSAYAMKDTGGTTTQVRAISLTCEIQCETCMEYAGLCTAESSSVLLCVFYTGITNAICASATESWTCDECLSSAIPSEPWFSRTGTSSSTCIRAIGVTGHVVQAVSSAASHVSQRSKQSYEQSPNVPVSLSPSKTQAAPLLQRWRLVQLARSLVQLCIQGMLPSSHCVHP